jgi:hypothetical protein
VISRRVPLRRSVPPQRRTPLPGGHAPERRTPVRPKRTRPRRGPERSADHLAWIRTLACVICSRVCGESTVIEAAHTNAMGRRGMSQKTSDFSAIPLCSAHHRDAPGSYHRLGEQRFAREYRIDLPQLVGALNDLFLRHISRPPAGADISEHHVNTPSGRDMGRWEQCGTV